MPEAPDLPLPSPVRDGNNMQWVREQTFSGLEGSYTRQGRGRKYVVGLAVIALAAFAYLRWAPEFRARVAPSASPSGTARAITQENSSLSRAPIQPETSVPESARALPPAVPATQRSSPTVQAHERAIVPAGIQPASQKSPVLAATTSRQSFVGQEGGAPDLRLAQRYLEGSMGVRDPAEAAKLLWKAVGKQNATAAILLSDLYQRGDGVVRSCDQARLLLVAAAKRGSPQAAQQLRSLELQGCR
jgi:TPR repeat protein